ncbi:hypothetical protein I5677_02110 [Mobilitalea sibirica]|uniref:Peptidase S54 rhomboid domain-containing protein n=1 Tax=Mobilitalea sibirica TaxID=1462919 RepID=A0A8J7HA82_9FIRM|nr:hypothetical protein [Mobilitalea sibirica]MBH1939686.1 hypothetical protein [Mobilitalea sibirica]
MKFINKLERLFGRYAIHNLMKYVAILYGIGFIISMLSPNIYYFFSLDFQSIAKGQIWRLVTFIIPRVGMGDLLWVAISVYVYYMIGNALERAWGAFRLNLYFFSGILFNLIAAFITYLITGISIPTSLEAINPTLFFAFAAMYPNTQFYIYFLIPVKAKYLAWFQGAMYLFTIYSYLTHDNQYYKLLIIPIVASMANFLIFFFATRNYNRISPREFQRKAKFHRQMQEARNQGPVTQQNGRNVVTRHKCAVCGRTELDDDQLEFRFCSKCDGNYEYCMEHLFTHEHVKK